MCGPAAVSSDQPYVDFPIFPRRQFLIEGVVKAFIWINTECLIIKIENQGDRHPKRSTAFRKLLFAKA